MAASRAFSEVIFLSKSVMVSNSFLGLEFNRQKKKALRGGQGFGGDWFFKFLPKEFFHDTENLDHNYGHKHILLLRYVYFAGFRVYKHEESPVFYRNRGI